MKPVIKPVNQLPEDLVVMGRLNRPYGVKGWFRVEVYTEYIDSLLDFDTWWVQKFSSQHNFPVSSNKPLSNENWYTFSLEEGKVYQDGLVVKLQGIQTPEEAQLWGRSLIAIPRSEFPLAENDAEYWIDLIGLSVFNTHDELLGYVDHLLETGAHDVLSIKGEKGNQLIPYTKPFLKSVDLEQRKIIVDWEWVSD